MVEIVQRGVSKEFYPELKTKKKETFREKATKTYEEAKKIAKGFVETGKKVWEQVKPKPLPLEIPRREIGIPKPEIPVEHIPSPISIPQITQMPQHMSGAFPSGVYTAKVDGIVISIPSGHEAFLLEKIPLGVETNIRYMGKLSV